MIKAGENKRSITECKHLKKPNTVLLFWLDEPFFDAFPKILLHDELVMHRCSRLLAPLKTKALLFFRILDSDREPLLPPNPSQFRQIPALDLCCKGLTDPF